jgi:hypothetical protein
MRISRLVSVGDVYGGRGGYGTIGMTGNKSKKCAWTSGTNIQGDETAILKLA